MSIRILYFSSYNKALVQPRNPSGVIPSQAIVTDKNNISLYCYIGLLCDNEITLNFNIFWDGCRTVKSSNTCNSNCDMIQNWWELSFLHDDVTLIDVWTRVVGLVISAAQQYFITVLFYHTFYQNCKFGALYCTWQHCDIGLFPISCAALTNTQDFWGCQLFTSED